MGKNRIEKTEGSLSFGGLTAMIIGSTIGAGIFTTAGDMASNGAHTGLSLIHIFRNIWQDFRRMISCF